MISYYEINTNRRILATNIAAVSEFSGISYHKIRNWLTETDLHRDQNIIIFQQDVIKGKQRLQKVGKVDRRETISGSGGPDHPVIHEEIQITEGQLNASEVVEKFEKATAKRKTKQPESRDMSGFDSFFSEVK
jgi:hypothetical protein